MEMEKRHRNLISLAMVVSLTRLIIRSALVIVSGSPEYIPLICTAILAFPILIHLRLKGGCSAVLLYVLIELIFTTSYWVITLYVLDTSGLCYKLGSPACEPADLSMQANYIRRPQMVWVSIIIPGFIFDLIFLYFFSRPLTVIKIDPVVNFEVVDHEYSERYKRRDIGIGSIGFK